jgi:hypothetical protein
MDPTTIFLNTASRPETTAGARSNYMDSAIPIINILPDKLKFGVISSGFYYTLKFSIKNNTLSPMRVRVDCYPTEGEKNSIRLAQLPDIIAPGMTTQIVLELTTEHVGQSSFRIKIGQNLTPLVFERIVDAHIVTPETFRYVKKSLHIQKRPIYFTNVELVGPMVGIYNTLTQASVATTFSETLIMDDEDMDDLFDLPMAPNVYWDPFSKCLRIDPQLGEVL